MSENANMILDIIKTPQNIKKMNTEFNKNIFENKYFTNFEYLINNSINTDFKQVWVLNPQKFCADTYSTYEIYPVILMINKLNSMFEFKPDRLKNTIVTPSLLSIYKVLTLIA
jgi:hypothetical protein